MHHETLWYLRGQELLDLLANRLGHADLFVQHAFHPRRFVATEVALWAFGPDDLAGPSEVKSALGAFVRFNFRHLNYRFRLKHPQADWPRGPEQC